MTAIFWVVTQRVVVIPYRRFGATNHSPLIWDPIGCSETSVMTTRRPRDRLDERCLQLLFVCSRCAFYGGKCKEFFFQCALQDKIFQRRLFLPSRDNAMLICCHFIGTNSTHSAELRSHVVMFRPSHGCCDGLISVLRIRGNWRQLKKQEISCVRRNAMWRDVRSVAIL